MSSLGKNYQGKQFLIKVYLQKNWSLKTVTTHLCGTMDPSIWELLTFCGCDVPRIWLVLNSWPLGSKGIKDSGDGCKVVLLRPDWPYAMFPGPRLLLCNWVPVSKIKLVSCFVSLDTHAMLHNYVILQLKKCITCLITIYCCMSSNKILKVPKLMFDL